MRFRYLAAALILNSFSIAQLATPAQATGITYTIAQATLGQNYNALANYEPISHEVRLYGADHLISHNTDPSLSWLPAEADLTFTLDTDAYPQGIYVVKWTTTTQNVATLVVTASPLSRTSRVVALVPDYTWTAYNETGGGSFYQGGEYPAFVTLAKARPQHKPDVLHDVAVLPSATLAASLGAAIDVVRESEVESLNYDLSSYDLIVLYGHDEYWTDQLRADIESAVSGGTNLLNAAGNVGFRLISDTGDAIRFEATGSTSIFTTIERANMRLFHARYLLRPSWFLAKSAAEKKRMISRALSHGLSKKMSAKQRTLHMRQLRVLKPNDPLFAGVTLDSFGYVGRPSGYLIGDEADGLPLTNSWALPSVYTRLLGSEPVGLLAGGFYSTLATPSATIIRSSSGLGQTINLGSSHWALAVYQGDSAAVTIMRNALTELLAS